MHEAKRLVLEGLAVGRELGLSHCLCVCVWMGPSVGRCLGWLVRRALHIIQVDLRFRWQRPPPQSTSVVQYLDDSPRHILSISSS